MDLPPLPPKWSHRMGDHTDHLPAAVDRWADADPAARELPNVYGLPINPRDQRDVNGVPIARPVDPAVRLERIRARVAAAPADDGPSTIDPAVIWGVVNDHEEQYADLFAHARDDLSWLLQQIDEHRAGRGTWLGRDPA